jgi:hypothetical protein
MSQPRAVALSLLLLAWTFGHPQGFAVADGGGDRTAMADAMSRMMEAMGFMGPGAQSGARPFGGGLDQAQRWGQAMMDGMGKGMPSGVAGTLEGLWEAAGGGLLIVQGSAYRLYAPNGAYVDGSLALGGDRLRLWNRTAGFAAELEYALDQGRLVLRDQSGQIYLYRRLELPGGG